MMSNLHRLWLLAALSIVTACGRAAPEAVATESVVPVTTVAAVVGTIRSVIHAAGLVEAAPGADLEVRPPAPGRIVEMPRAQGDAVRRGDLLVAFEIPALAADAAAKRADVERATARVRNAGLAEVRARDLLDRGVAARRELEDAEREVVDAGAALAEARAALVAAAALEGRAVVRAPFDGVIATRSHNPNDLVEPGSTEPVLRLIDPRRLEVGAGIAVSDVPLVTPGAAARVMVSADQDPEPATVVSRPAAVDSRTASAPIRLRFNRPTRLAAGTPVRVEIDAVEHRDVVVVPAAAVVSEGGETAVFVVAAGKAARRVVETGIASRDHVEIRSGLKAGDLVITRGQAGLPDGAPVSTAQDK